MKDVEKQEDESLAKMNVWYISDTESKRDNLEGFLAHTVRDPSNTAIMIVLDMG